LDDVRCGAFMFAQLGLAALVVLVGVETFALSAAILWSLAALADLGAAVEDGALIIAGVLGVAAGYAMARLAIKSRESK